MAHVKHRQMSALLKKRWENSDIFLGQLKTWKYQSMWNGKEAKGKVWKERKGFQAIVQNPAEILKIRKEKKKGEREKSKRLATRASI